MSVFLVLSLSFVCVFSSVATVVVPSGSSSLSDPDRTMNIIYPYPNTPVYVGETFKIVVQISARQGFCQNDWSVWLSATNNINLQLAAVDDPDHNPGLTQTLTTITLPAAFQEQNITTAQIYAQCDWTPPETFKPVTITIGNARGVYAEIQTNTPYYYGTVEPLKWLSFGPNTTLWGIWAAPVWGPNRLPPAFTQVCSTADLSCDWTTPTDPDNGTVAFQIRDASQGNDPNHIISTTQIQVQHVRISLSRPSPLTLILTPNMTYTVQWSTSGPMKTLASLTYNGIQMDPTTSNPSNTGSYVWNVPSTLQLLSTLTIGACVQLGNVDAQCDSYGLTVLPPPKEQVDVDME